MQAIRCSCGRFCIPADRGTHYGAAPDLDEPEETFWCPRCASAELQYAITTPEKVIIACWWRKPYYVRVAKSILRHRRKTNDERKHAPAAASIVA